MFIPLGPTQDVFSNEPTSVTRTIPTWAVAVIVVLNSVIIVTLLLIILAIIWRRYSR